MKVVLVKFVVAGIIIVAVVLIGYGIIRWIDWSSVSNNGGGAMPATLACNINIPLSGDNMTVSLTRRPSVFESWTKARSQLIADARDEAEEEALESLEDYFDDIDCPDECPVAVWSTNAAGDRVVNYSTTNSRITGSSGLGYMRYDGSGTSTASTTFQCQPES